MVTALLISLMLQSATPPDPTSAVSDEEVQQIAQPMSYFRFRVVPFVVISPDAQGAIKILGDEDGCALVATQTDEAIAANFPQYSSMVVSAFRREIPEEVLSRAASEQSTTRNEWYQPYSSRINGALSSPTEGIILHDCRSSTTNQRGAHRRNGEAWRG